MCRRLSLWRGRGDVPRDARVRPRVAAAGAWQPAPGRQLERPARPSCGCRCLPLWQWTGRVHPRPLLLRPRELGKRGHGVPRARGLAGKWQLCSQHGMKVMALVMASCRRQGQYSPSTPRLCGNDGHPSLWLSARANGRFSQVVAQLG